MKQKFFVLLTGISIIAACFFTTATTRINDPIPPTPPPPPHTLVPTETQSPNPTQAPTSTNRPPPTPIPVDLVADKIEIVQTIQDLDNSVRLVAGKRTFVRFYVHSAYLNSISEARLHVRQGTDEVWLDPLFYPQIYINHKIISRHIIFLVGSFLFELPSEFTHGPLTLTAELNPDTATRDRDPVETTYGNNIISVENITFEEVPTVNLVLYRADYDFNGITYHVPLTETLMIYDYLERTFPLSDLGAELRMITWGEGELDANNFLVKPDCIEINDALLEQRLIEVQNNAVSADTRYYAIWKVDNYGAVGCANDSPSYAASGPTGITFKVWDVDGTYGDHFAAHELGHAFGQKHVRGSGPSPICGTEARPDPDYPHISGRISPSLEGDQAVYGLDTQAWRIIQPSWKDFMTYCDNLWISDYTYHALMDTFQNQAAVLLKSLSKTEQVDRLSIIGRIDTATEQVNLRPLFIIPNADDIEPRIPGVFAIVLQDENNAELARYPFTPTQIHSGPTRGGAFQTSEDQLSISEWVPYVAGATRVVIEGPGGVMAEVSAGVAAPTVTVTSPNGGENLGGDSITVSWEARDTDGDPLTFKVLYSPDNGATWKVVAQDVISQTAEIPAKNLAGSTQALFSIWASDGIHTGEDQSDAPFTIPNRIPTVLIFSPETDSTIATDQTLNLDAFAYDVETGTMDAAQLEWRSNLDGVLGSGDQFSVAGLSVGAHTITFKADDGNGGIVEESVQVTVVGDISQLPPLPNGLLIGPDSLYLSPSEGLASRKVSVYNQNFSASIAWEAVPSEPWLELSHTSGITPFDELVVSADYESLPVGWHQTTITFTSPNLPGEVIEIPVRVNVVKNDVYLPLVDK